jgi:hypothetical protein
LRFTAKAKSDSKDLVEGGRGKGFPGCRIISFRETKAVKGFFGATLLLLDLV